MIQVLDELINQINKEIEAFPEAFKKYKNKLEDLIKTTRKNIQNHEKEINRLNILKENNNRNLNAYEDSIKKLKKSIGQYNSTLEVYNNELAYYKKIADVLETKIDEYKKTNQLAKNLSPKNDEKEASRPKDKQTNTKTKFKPAGLTNIGNTCYFNAAMQALCASQKFREFVRKNSGKSNLAKALHNLFTKMAESKNALDRQTMGNFFNEINKLAKTYFTVGNQQDAMELITHILDNIDAKSNIDVSLLCTTWVYNNRDVCNRYFTSADTNDSESCSVTVESFIQKYILNEFCIQYIKHLPKILVVSNSNLNINIDYRQELILNEKKTQNAKENKVRYRLVSVINKSGNANSGHYWAFVKCQDATWHEQNDGSSKDITSQFSGGIIKTQGGKPLIFIYERVD